MIAALGAGAIEHDLGRERQIPLFKLDDETMRFLQRLGPIDGDRHFGREPGVGDDQVPIAVPSFPTRLQLLPGRILRRSAGRLVQRFDVNFVPALPLAARVNLRLANSIMDAGRTAAMQTTLPHERSGGLVRR